MFLRKCKVVTVNMRVRRNGKTELQQMKKKMSEKNWPVEMAEYS